MNKTRFKDSDLQLKGYVPDGKGGFIPAKDAVKKDEQKKAPHARGLFSHVKKNDKGMNKTESSYALYLDALKQSGEIHDWWFEALTLKLAPDTRLTVDFLIQKKDGFLELHDTKGSLFMFLKTAKVKMKVAQNMFPFKFFVVYPKPQKQGGGWLVVPIANT